ncbi:hypothetical protein A3J78_00910 [Candidatus Beckwithbacteria bacterium RBG_13_35_6]|uniref:Uncharacterized protein n=1 Tax=Candidatus Beckwithbacteria bacterium RBG_13_35_6 TaxID=1797456 RepID=A0A1F5DDI4_9BACT|nr:MAG: hypothetical protein A3J78_00910 [Candidatus Beckwithbacteria bacterium RBG_13_35_6]
MKKSMENKQGLALISIMAITAIGLIVISTILVMAVVNLKIITGYSQAQKAKKTAESLLNDAVLRFLRNRDLVNYYPSWSQPCLQIENTQCKMELSLTPAGGVIESWGRSGIVVRHLAVDVEVLADDSVSISRPRELD